MSGAASKGAIRSCHKPDGHVEYAAICSGSAWHAGEFAAAILLWIYLPLPCLCVFLATRDLAGAHGEDLLVRALCAHRNSTVLRPRRSPGEPRPETPTSGLAVFCKNPSQLRAGSILPSLASRCTRAQNSTINSPPAPPSFAHSLKRRAHRIGPVGRLRSSGQAGKKVSPHAVHAIAFPPPAPSRPDCTPMIMLSQQPPLDACGRSSPSTPM